MSEIELVAYGAGQAREGLCLGLRLGPHRLLLDCGLRDLAPLGTVEPPTASPETEPPADWVLCSHAHRDHARGLLGLHQRYRQLPVLASEVTARLLPLNWLDRPPIAAFCRGLPWRVPIPLADDLRLELFPAGHLPGAALSLLTYRDRAGRDCRVLFAGDFFLSNARLVEGLPLGELRGLEPDVAIIEGSYGTARHARRRTQENDLAEQVRQGLEAGRSVILPVPILGLGQELLMLLRSHHYFTGRDFTIWVEDTVAAGCDAYLTVLADLPLAVQNFARHQNLFWDDRVRPRVRRLAEGGGDGCPGSSPCLLLVDDDTPLEEMIDRYCQTGRWLVLWPAAEPEVSPVERGDRLTHARYTLSEHCDALGTLQLIHNLRPRHLVLVHGSPDNLSDLAGLGELGSRYQIHCPVTGSRLELPVGETFLQPAAPAERYEGEISQTSEGITLELPAALGHSPRWQALADTGLVEARWQGTDLVLRGLSQRELLEREDDWLPPEATCCQTCQFYRDRVCRNPASPLHGRKVAPDGCCPGFAPADPPPE